MYFKKYSVDVISYYLLISSYFFYKQECSSAQIQYNHSIFFLYFKRTHTHTHTPYSYVSLYLYVENYKFIPIPSILIQYQ